MLGLGVDLVELDRVESSLQRWGDRLVAKLMDPTEAARLPAGGADRNAIPIYDVPDLLVMNHYVREAPLNVSSLRSLGGFGNVEGTILAGLLVGLIESFTTQYLGPGLIDIVVFALLLFTLAVRPTGLIAEKREENV